MMSKPYDQKDHLPDRGAVQQDLAPSQVRDLSDRGGDSLPRRRMIGGGSKLGVNCDKLIAAGFHPYWRNDQDGRVQEALANGYEFVKPSEIEEVTHSISATEMSGEKVSRVVGYTDKGEPIVAYLMKIKQEWFDENQAYYQKRAAAIDNAIRNGTTTPVEEAYRPKEGIHYQNRNR